MLTKLKNIDFPLLAVTILLSIAGIAVIYSLVFATTDSNIVIKQIVFFSVGIVALVLLSNLDYKMLSGTSWYLYAVVIVLLVVVDLYGKTTGGATRWIDLRVFQLQPSEIYKFASVIFLASFFSKRIGRVRVFDLLYAFFMLLPPLYLVLVEPDLGTALVIVFSWITVVIFSKLTLKQYLFFAISGITFITIFVLSVKNIAPFGPLLKDYQRERVEVFLNPASDQLRSGYNVKQAQIAIGSGGFWGKGLGQGSQSQLKFLPKPETDFIFAGYAEAFGFVGSILLFVAFIFLLSKIVDIAKESKDNLGYLLAVGIGATFIFQVGINVAMNIGLAPVTGIPLPFVSAGGTSLIVSFAMIGVLQSIHIHRKKISF
ncbi:MAG: rod shape-determining protein RodA [Patescibacteria group bacterium]|jgi:rod shape determining protein RodA